MHGAAPRRATRPPRTFPAAGAAGGSAGTCSTPEPVWSRIMLGAGAPPAARECARALARAAAASCCVPVYARRMVVTPPAWCCMEPITARAAQRLSNPSRTPCVRHAHGRHATRVMLHGANHCARPRSATTTLARPPCAPSAWPSRHPCMRRALCVRAHAASPCDAVHGSRARCRAGLPSASVARGKLPGSPSSTAVA